MFFSVYLLIGVQKYAPFIVTQHSSTEKHEKCVVRHCQCNAIKRGIRKVLSHGGWAFAYPNWVPPWLELGPI